jgi:indole-3-glycerol phosphate synthase
VSTRSSTVLERILAETREEVERRKRNAPLQSAGERPSQERAAGERPQRGGSAGRPEGEDRPFRDALAGPGVGVIGEFKRRSPSAGSLRKDPQLAEIVRAYERGGAVALSVLTEGPNFDGSLEDLASARAVCTLPILRKDFILDSYQLEETRSAGAAAVLLIAAALGERELAALHDEARAMGLDVLVEVHERAELQAALELGADIVGINNRDLRDFSVDVERTSRLVAEIPPGVVSVSESGIEGAADVQRLGEAGVHAVLVGEALMRAADPEAAVRRLRNFYMDR